MTKQILTQEHLKEKLHYNPETGIFTWKVSKSNKTVMIGDIAGHNHTTRGKTYRLIKIKSIQ